MGTEARAGKPDPSRICLFWIWTSCNRGKTILFPCFQSKTQRFRLVSHTVQLWCQLGFHTCDVTVCFCKGVQQVRLHRQNKPFRQPSRIHPLLAAEHNCQTVCLRSCWLSNCCNREPEPAGRHKPSSTLTDGNKCSNISREIWGDNFNLYL